MSFRLSPTRPVRSAFCWNFSNYSQYADQTQFTPFAMAFPSDDGTPELEMAGPYGFGIFDNKDQAKIERRQEVHRLCLQRCHRRCGGCEDLQLLPRALRLGRCLRRR